MPWRNLPPDIVQSIMQVLGLAIAGILGSASRIAEQIVNGERKKVWGKALVIDAISFVLMLIVALAIVEHYNLAGWQSVAVGAILGRAGTPILDKVFQLLLAGRTPR